MNWGIRVLQTHALPLGYGAGIAARVSIAHPPHFGKTIFSFSPRYFIISSNSDSSIILTPRDLALSSFEPAFSPAST